MSPAPSLAAVAALPFILLAARPATAAQPRAAKPNVVVIVSDDAGFNEFSMHGSKLFPTPRIDSIAADGVRFATGYVSGPVCSPTRAGLLTGRYQQRFGHEFNIPPVYSDENGLPLSETTLADALKAAGYRTVALGKWHLGYAPRFHPMARGFTDYYGFLQGARSYFPLAAPTRLNELLRDREPVRPERFDYMTDELARAAAEYIAGTRDRPFFLYLAFNATHAPTDVLPADLARVEAAGGGGNLRHRAMSAALDRAVGVVLDALTRRGVERDTLVVFVNDNGGAAGHDNAPLRGQKGSTWEGGVRIPFAMRWPAVLPRGRVYEHPVISLDVFPTVAAAAGARLPERPLDGVNLVPFVTGAAPGRPHQTLFWKLGPAWAVRDGDLKLVGGNTGAKKGKQDADTPALFDLARDPAEKTDLVAARPADVARLAKLHAEWRRDFPRPRWGADAKGD